MNTAVIVLLVISVICGIAATVLHFLTDRDFQEHMEELRGYGKKE